MEAQQLLNTAQTAHLLETAEQLYQAALQAIGLQPGEYLILDPFVEEAFLQSALAAGARPIFIDLSPEGQYLDTQLLEDFLSLSTLVNARDELIYRKDEQVVRALVLTQNNTSHTAIAPIKFIARRYHLPIIEEFTSSFGQQDIGIHGAVSVAWVQGPTDKVGLLLQRDLPTLPFSLGSHRQKKPLFIPRQAQLLTTTATLQPLSVKAAPAQSRLDILRENIFLSRNKVAQNILQQASKKNKQDE